MSVRILRYESNSKPIQVDLLVSTIEKSRDRVRTVGNMLITTSSILIPACLAFLLFFADKGHTDALATIPLGLAIVLFLVTSCLSIVSSLLRRRYILIDEAQLVRDLLTSLNEEVQISRYAFFSLIVGIVAMTSSTLIFVMKYWR